VTLRESDDDVDDEPLTELEAEVEGDSVTEALPLREEVLLSEIDEENDNELEALLVELSEALVLEVALLLNEDEMLAEIDWEAEVDSDWVTVVDPDIELLDDKLSVLLELSDSVEERESLVDDDSDCDVDDVDVIELDQDTVSESVDESDNDVDRVPLVVTDEVRDLPDRVCDFVTFGEVVKLHENEPEGLEVMLDDNEDVIEWDTVLLPLVDAEPFTLNEFDVESRRVCESDALNEFESDTLWVLVADWETVRDAFCVSEGDAELETEGVNEADVDDVCVVLPVEVMETEVDPEVLSVVLRTRVFESVHVADWETDDDDVVVSDMDKEDDSDML
jgi:hypothetical protein